MFTENDLIYEQCTWYKGANIPPHISNKYIIFQSFMLIFKKSQSKSRKSSLFSFILIIFVLGYAIKMG